MTMREIYGTEYLYDDALDVELGQFRENVRQMREVGGLSSEVLHHLRSYFRIKNIYHSNAIEGNRLNVGETRLVVEQGLTITGKPLKDTLEAKNLSEALDLLEQLASNVGQPITETDIRSVHRAILRGINDLDAGRYRAGDVEISGSAYRPPEHFKVPAEMERFAFWLGRVTSAEADPASLDPILIACSAHAWFTYIHPFIDGNGRTARILMNLALMRSGYPIAIVTNEDRQRYYDALEESQAADLTPFIALIIECLKESLEEYQTAAREQLERAEWARTIVSSIGEHEEERLRLEYDIWSSAIYLLKNYFAQTVDLCNSSDTLGVVRAYYKDFGQLEFEKYVSLRRGGSAKHTWSFRVDFRAGEKAARFLFFFGFPAAVTAQKFATKTVTLHVAHEDSPYHFSRVAESDRPALPELCEVGYDQSKEQFLCRYRGGTVRHERVEVFGRRFIQEIAKRCF